MIPYQLRSPFHAATSFPLFGTPRLECLVLLSTGGPRLAPDCPRVDPNCPAICRQKIRCILSLVQKCPQTGPQVGPNCAQHVSRLCLNCAQTVPRHAVARAIARVTGWGLQTHQAQPPLSCMLPEIPRFTKHALASCQISPDSQTLTCMLLSPCRTHLTLSCMLPDSARIADTLLQVSKLYRLNCASRSMLLQVFHFCVTPRLECSVLLSQTLQNTPPSRLF